MLGHGLVKATMFVVAGRILAAEGSSSIDDVHGLLARRPDLARPLLAGTAALLGFPPFVLFFTEVAIVVAGWANGLGPAMAVALLLLLVVFAGFSRQVAAMTLGVTNGPAAGDAAPVEERHPSLAPPETARAGAGRQAPLVVALTAAVLLGFAARPLAELLTDAAAVLAGGR
jgi:hydrogenase-4 component F